MQVVNVYGKLDGSCSLCESAKDKLKRLGVPFQSFELEDAVAPHDGRRNDETVQVMATYSDIATYPVITVDGDAMSYPEAMKLLKRKPKVQVVQLPVLETPQVERTLLAAVG